MIAVSPEKPWEDLFGYRITLKSVGECARELHSWIVSRQPARYFVCANPHSLEVARSDALFKTALRSADMAIPDGIGMVLASRLLGGKVHKRIAGTDLFLEISRLLNDAGHFRYFFLGSTQATLLRIVKRMTADFPHVEVAGTYAPPFVTEFREEETSLMVEQVNQSGADVLWVGLTAPKQEKWVYSNRDRLKVGVIGAIGAVFDFFAGSVKRSHPTFQRMGLEWFPRLLREPRRLWRRNFVSSPRFLLRVLRERGEGKKT